METVDRGATRRDQAPPEALRAREAIGLLLAFGAIAVVVYRACLSGPFLSDDALYYVVNPAVASPSLDSVLAVLDPRSQTHIHTHNYAPVHLLLVMAERWLFQTWMAGYHVTHVFLHAVNAVLLVALLISSRVPRVPAILGGALFLLHPAQVEAVAWLSQLKSLACAALGFGALLCLDRHPRASSALFGLALLTKFSAVAFLPMAAVLLWARGAPRATWVWLAVWVALLAAVAVPQLTIFGYGTSHEVGVFEDRLVQLRTMAAIGFQYLWMACTGLGLSTYHDPPPARSALDLRFLLGLALGAALAARTLVTLMRRDEEAAWWTLAAAAFVPVSQIVPFRYPVADRYLYFILPGLIGGGWLATLSLGRWLRARGAARSVTRAAGWGAWAAGAMAAVWFGYVAIHRTPLWVDHRLLTIDAARNYPEGSQALYMRAALAAEEGDAERAVALLRRLEERWRFSLVNDFDRNPLFVPIRDDPAFRELVRETARFRIELSHRRGMQPGEEVMLAFKYVSLGEYQTAIELVETAIRRGDPRRDELIGLLGEIRALRREARGSGGGSAVPD